MHDKKGVIGTQYIFLIMKIDLIMKCYLYLAKLVVGLHFWNLSSY